MSRKAWTDYPFTGLGDTPGVGAPVREVQIVGYDHDKYATILVPGLAEPQEIKSGYLYKTRGGYGTPAYRHRDLRRMFPDRGAA